MTNGTVELRLKTPLTDDDVRKLKSGDRVLLSGYVYTARDAAHMRMMKALESGEELPIDVDGQVIYYVGPTPERPGEVIGSAGPTTSGRMDDMTVPLFEKGLKGMIGKGSRKDKVIEGMMNYGVAYFAAPGGAGALLSSCVKSLEIIAYEDLGPESIKRLYVEDMPLIVVTDSYGDDLYKTEPLKYKGQ